MNDYERRMLDLRIARWIEFAGVIMGLAAMIGLVWFAMRWIVSGKF